MAEKYAAVGHVVQVIGPVLDVQFEAGHLPAIYNAVRITSEGYNLPEPLDVTAEVQQHLGEGRVRAVSMEPVEGMVATFPPSTTRFASPAKATIFPSRSMSPPKSNSTWAKAACAPFPWSRSKAWFAA